MFIDNLYFHTTDVHVLVCLNDSMALQKKKNQVTRSITLIQLAINLLPFNLAFYNLSTS